MTSTGTIGIRHILHGITEDGATVRFTQVCTGIRGILHIITEVGDGLITVDITEDITVPTTPVITGVDIMMADFMVTDFTIATIIITDREEVRIQQLTMAGLEAIQLPFQGQMTPI